MKKELVERRAPGERVKEGKGERGEVRAARIAAPERSPNAQ